MNPNLEDYIKQLAETMSQLVKLREEKVDYGVGFFTTSWNLQAYFGKRLFQALGFWIHWRGPSNGINSVLRRE